MAARLPITVAGPSRICTGFSINSLETCEGRQMPKCLIQLLVITYHTSLYSCNIIIINYSLRRHRFEPRIPPCRSAAPIAKEIKVRISLAFRQLLEPLLLAVNAQAHQNHPSSPPCSRSTPAGRSPRPPNGGSVIIPRPTLGAHEVVVVTMPFDVRNFDIKPVLLLSLPTLPTHIPPVATPVAPCLEG